MNNRGSLFFGIAIGVAAGALAGLLFAPDKGTETRRKLLERGNDYTNNLKNKYNNFRSKFRKGEYAAENEFRQETATSPSI